MRDALRRRDRVALELVADCDEDVQLVAVPGELRVRRRRVADRLAAVDAGGLAGRALPALADVQRRPAVLARALGPVELRRRGRLRDRRGRDERDRQVLAARAGRRAVGRPDRDRRRRPGGQRRVGARQLELDGGVRAGRQRGVRLRRRVGGEAGRQRQLDVPGLLLADQLWTSTGTVIVSPIAIDCAAAERPTRSARGAVSVIHSSYSAHLPQRWKRPSTGETTRTRSFGVARLAAGAQRALRGGRQRSPARCAGVTSNVTVLSRRDEIGPMRCAGPTFQPAGAVSSRLPRGSVPLPERTCTVAWNAHRAR